VDGGACRVFGGTKVSSLLYGRGVGWGRVGEGADEEGGEISEWMEYIGCGRMYMRDERDVCKGEGTSIWCGGIVW